MAKANWAVVSPQSGSGNATVNVSSNAPHTGRNIRTTVLTITAANVSAKTVSVTQQGKPAYVDAVDNAAAEKGGQNVTISGKSNAAKLTFSLGTGELNITLPTTYMAGGVQTNNGSATAEYDFSIVISVPANSGTEELSRQIIVTDGEGHTDTCLLTQTAGDATLVVSKTAIELAYTGEAVSFDITSNTSWIISEWKRRLNGMKVKGTLLLLMRVAVVALPPYLPM